MTRLRVIVEGTTEEAFVEQVLAPYLAASNIFATATIIGRPGKRGGGVTFKRLFDDFVLTLKQDAGCFCTSLVDFYGLGGGFPAQPENVSATAYVAEVEAFIQAAVEDVVPCTGSIERCIPYIQMYEFEGLLFSDVNKLSAAVYMPSVEPKLAAIRSLFQSPEEINDSYSTAPSKRLMNVVPSYNKVLHGSLAAGHIGIDSMMRECPRFRAWIERLFALHE